MRSQLLYNPRLLLERLAIASLRQRRLAKLRKTIATDLVSGHIDSLELIEIAKELGIDSIYDIGANVGTWALLAKSLIPGARIDGFEPLPIHQERFVKNFVGIAGVNLHSISLGSENDQGSLHVTDFTDATSLLPLANASKSHFGISEVGVIPTEVRKLDDFRKEFGLPLPDLIKLDVQGYELEVLKGARECLHATKAVISEVSFIEYYHGQCLFHELVAFLADYGLYVNAVGVNTHLGRTIDQTDVLFTRR
jgi:FkbM family methyltransferase